MKVFTDNGDEIVYDELSTLAQMVDMSPILQAWDDLEQAVEEIYGSELKPVELELPDPPVVARADNREYGHPTPAPSTHQFKITWM